MEKVALAIVTVAIFTSAAQADPIRETANIYNDTEKRLGEMRHLSFKEFNPEGEYTNTLSAWFDHDSSLRKVSDDGISSHGDRLEEYYFDSAGRLVFTFVRTEQTPFTPAAKTTVTEERFNFDQDSKLVRHLTKRGVFPEGAQLDMAAIKNVPKAIAGDARKACSAHGAKARAIVARLELAARPDEPGQVGAPDSVFPHGADYRLIEGTASPDLRWGIGWAPAAKKDVDWAEHLQEDGTYLGEPGKCRNFLIDLARRERLVEIPSGHFGDKALYNHTGCRAHWSPDSLTVIYSTLGKWHTESSHLVRIDGETGHAAVTDLKANATTAAFAALEKYGHAAHKKHGEDFAINVEQPLLYRSGAGAIDLTGLNVPAGKAGEPDASFKVRVQFDENGKITGSRVEEESE